MAGEPGIIEGAMANDHPRIIAEIQGLQLHLVKGAILNVDVGRAARISRSHGIVTGPVRTKPSRVACRILEGNCFLVLVVIVKGPVPYHAPIDLKADHVQEAAIGIKGTVVEKRRSANNNPDLILPGRISAIKTDPTDRTGERGRVGNN